MTVLSPTQIVGMALPSLAPSSSSGPSGSGLGAPISVDWSRAADARGVKTQKERKAAIAKAKKAVESRAETKRERLAKNQSNRDTGSNAERAATKGSVAKAMAAMEGAPSDTDISDNDFRAVREVLKQRYPGRPLSDIIANGERIEADFKADPVQARQKLVASYSHAPGQTNMAAFKAPVYEKGLRGSLQRARADQADAEDIKAAQEKYGRNLPQILAQLESWDRALHMDIGRTSAKLAAEYGAPATEEEVPVYLAAQEQKAHAAHLAQRHANIQKGVHLAIEQGHIPGDEDTLEEMAAVMKLPQFQHNLSNPLDSLKRAAAIAAHPDHKRITPRKGGKSKRDPGQMSISGAPGTGQGGRASRTEAGQGSFRDSMARVRAAM